MTWINTMNKLDDLAWKREFEHANKVQEQRKSINEFMIREEEMIEIDNALKDRPIETKAIAEQYQSNTKQAICTVLGLTLLAIVVVYLSWGGL